MRACLRGLAVRRFLLPMLVIIGVHSLNYAQDSAYYWNPAPLGIGSTLPTGSIDAVTTPGSRILTTNATGFGAATPASESLLFASIPSSPSGLIEWTAPDPSGGAMTSGSVAGVMLRFTENTSLVLPSCLPGCDRELPVWSCVGAWRKVGRLELLPEPSVAQIFPRQADSSWSSYRGGYSSHTRNLAMHPRTHGESGWP